MLASISESEIGSKRFPALRFLESHVTEFPSMLQAEVSGVPEPLIISETLESSLGSWTHQDTALALGFASRITVGPLRWLCSDDVRGQR